MWWQVLGSNQRRLSRRFYRALPIKITYSLWPAETRFLRALSSRLNHSSTESRSGSPGMSGRHWLVAVVAAFILAGPGVGRAGSLPGCRGAPRRLRRRPVAVVAVNVAVNSAWTIRCAKLTGSRAIRDLAVLRRGRPSLDYEPYDASLPRRPVSARLADQDTGATAMGHTMLGG
jgi:hypothetical protein